jgi:hypothetical protein
LKALKGGFFLRKKPLECVLPVNSNSENAIPERRCARNVLILLDGIVPGPPVSFENQAGGGKFRQF